jgi:hypothetical protein
MSQKHLRFVQRDRILLRCGSAFALSLPSLGVSSLDLGRLFIQAALFSCTIIFVALVIPGRAQREPGIHTPDGGYGFRARSASLRAPE